MNRNRRTVKVGRTYRSKRDSRCNKQDKIKKYIPPGTSFGTKMKFKIQRTIEYTSISMATKVCMKVLGYLHHQFAILIDHPVVVS